MIALAVFAFIAGIVTILSPCILPILPVILSSSVDTSGKKRPFGIVLGFILSFTFFTLFLSTIVKISGIPSDFLRNLSVAIVLFFGLSLLIPKYQIILEKLFLKIAVFVPSGYRKTGITGGFLIGLSLGLLWSPCVGPILASVISLAIAGSVTLNAFFITFAFSLGTAIPMFLIMLGGQNVLKKVPWLLSNSANVQKIFGIVMVLTAFAIFFNFDRKFQSFIINKFPNYGVGLTKIENNNFVHNELSKLNAPEIKKEDMGKPMSDVVQKGPQAPEIIQGGEWFNSKPLKVSELKGKVVLIHFWTYSCINCQRTFPYLKNWYTKYKDKGLVIIGVHSPEFEFEKESKNVADAIKNFGIKYPVVQDNNFATWQSYENQYWPAKYFIDKDGFIRFAHFGEGAYDESERVIQKLLSETGTSASLPIKNLSYKIDSNTPETYLGYKRISNFSSLDSIAQDNLSEYKAPEMIPDNSVAFNGMWTITSEYAAPVKGASLFLSFEAKDVFLVMRPKENTTVEVNVYLDGKFIKTVIADADKLYPLINLKEAGRHILRLEFLDGNAELYAFTFG